MHALQTRLSGVDWAVAKNAAVASVWDLAPAAISGLVAGVIGGSKVLATASSQLSTPLKWWMLAVVVAGGILATLFKKKSLTSFGYSELAFGVVVAWRIIWSQLGTDSLANGAALIAASFLISRGCQDSYDALLKEYQQHMEVKKAIEQLQKKTPQE